MSDQTDFEAGGAEPLVDGLEYGGYAEQDYSGHPLAEELAELRAQLAQQGMVNGAQMLVDEIPDMGDPEIGPQVVEAARQIAESMGRPDLANSPDWWRMVYLAGEGQDAVAARQPREMTADDIFATGRAGRSALPFH